jgi:hypothetical protein
MFRQFIATTITCALLATANVAKAEDKAELPRIAAIAPLGALLGETTRVKIRGWKIGDATDVRCSNPQVQVKILNKGGAPLPNRHEAKQVGDTQVEIELNVAKDTPAGSVSFNLVTPQGEVEVKKFFIGGEFAVIPEKEPNDGFREAQAITIPQIVEGSIHNERNVDVYELSISQQQSLRAEIVSTEFGNTLDSILTLYDERKNILAINDDAAGKRDSVLEVSVQPGRYYLVLQDAHDRGGPTHAYRLKVSQH